MKTQLIYKTLPAQGAGIELLSSVNSLVCDQIRFARTTLSTPGTGQRVISRVTSLVSNKIMFTDKTFPTF
ncbi:hypothetical protein GDO81_002812 [Engystomops pustulosus]|uniref:Uncharacterized protein n=1 Tax=Engystomops pustulosus TaxID=76066 RepID=A0AAV7DN16_ENGPU|nr:hypothetical protein GDO81_002812 [Engystomops pustulosus]